MKVCLLVIKDKTSRGSKPICWQVTTWLTHVMCHVTGRRDLRDPIAYFHFMSISCPLTVSWNISIERITKKEPSSELRNQLTNCQNLFHKHRWAFKCQQLRTMKARTLGPEVIVITAYRSLSFTGTRRTGLSEVCSVVLNSFHRHFLKTSAEFSACKDTYECIHLLFLLRSCEFLQSLVATRRPFSLLVLRSVSIFAFLIDVYLNLNIPGIDHFHDSHNVVKHKAKLFTVI